MRINPFRIAILSLAFCGCFADNEDDSSPSDEAFGVDVSWPMQHSSGVVSPHQNWEQYWSYMKGCKDKFGEICETNDADRIAMNLAQPAYQKNFTSAGYAKVPAPVQTFQLLREFFEKSGENARTESWDRGNIHINHWDVETLLVMVDDPERSKAMPLTDRRIIVEEVQTVLERWGGVPLSVASLYGIRMYQKGSVLAPHVDRLPLVISAIVNVAQSVDKEWPLEVIGHDGIAVNVTLQPGEMILYESHSVIHGRPYPLQGSFYANVFLHFEPIGYTFELERKIKASENRVSAREKYEAALLRNANGEANSDDAKTPDLPPHIKEYSEEAARWRQEFIFLREDKRQLLENNRRKTKEKADEGGVTTANLVAANGQLDILEKLAKKDPSILQKKDGNGWQPIHEAARSGQTKVVEYLINQGVDLNARTNNGKGASPLWWAEHMLPNTHPTIRLLRQNGAKSTDPGD